MWFFVTNWTGAINVTYATVPGLLTLSNQTEGTLAEPEADYIAVSDSLILEEGETSAAINITILEVNFKPYHSILSSEIWDHTIGLYTYRSVWSILIRRGIFWNLKLATYILLKSIYLIVI